MDRPVPPATSASTPRPGAAALPAVGGRRRRRDVRRARPLVDDGLIAAYGLSVETATRRWRDRPPHVASIQIILNAFRLKPLDRVLPAAADAGVAIIARVPLASGLLTGKYDASTTFAPDDHRSYNRDGSAFDVGETFSGVDYESGLAAAGEFAGLGHEPPHSGVTTAQAALAWVAQQTGVTSASSPVPATPTRRGPTRLPARSVRCPKPSSTAYAGSTTSGSGSPCTLVGDGCGGFHRPRSAPVTFLSVACPSGRRCNTRNVVWGNPPWVQIPPPPPAETAPDVRTHLGGRCSFRTTS